jgi:class 3 adenylate cyclase
MIGDAVNTVSRLEELNKVYGSTIIASARTIAEVGPQQRAGFEGPLEVALRGREAAIAVHVFGKSE